MFVGMMTSPSPDVVLGSRNGSCKTHGARFTKQTYNNLYPKFLVKQSYNVF